MDKKMESTTVLEVIVDHSLPLRTEILGSLC